MHFTSLSTNLNEKCPLLLLYCHSPFYALTGPLHFLLNSVRPIIAQIIQVGEIPPGFGDMDIPLQISVSLPERYAEYFVPVLSRNPMTVGAKVCGSVPPSYLSIPLLTITHTLIGWLSCSVLKIGFSVSLKGSVMNGQTGLGAAMLSGWLIQLPTQPFPMANGKYGMLPFLWKDNISKLFFPTGIITFLSIAPLTLLTGWKLCCLQIIENYLIGFGRRSFKFIFGLTMSEQCISSVYMYLMIHNFHYHCRLDEKG
ncbi:hypothetical protein Moror_15722 [Moniliophthora roreri MCA 2997]|uniref:Uncharacterized protein n=1 Tax=Moniliophthora roreri (strain MCA 2997) TaxID=1381753 RepID=V2Y049_MONRO|nr:hypothetical protein Moror_15722 [Moniliophthora roreri MCA 2997]